MRIDQAGIPETALPAARARRRQPGFSVPEESEHLDAAGLRASRAGSADPDANPAGACRPSPTSADNTAAATQGEALLGAMAKLQLATLGGDGEAARQHLAALAKTPPAAADPALDSVLQAIAQRAAVELARQE